MTAQAWSAGRVEGKMENNYNVKKGVYHVGSQMRINLEGIRCPAMVTRLNEDWIFLNDKRVYREIKPSEIGTLKQKGGDLVLEVK